MACTRIAALAALLSCGLSSAFAQGGDRNWYVGVDLGQSKLERNDFIGVTEQDDSSSAYAVRAGYRFSRYFSLEGGYVDMGDFSTTFLPDCPSCVTGEARTSIDGFFVNALGTWPITEHFHLKGMLGVSWRELKQSVSYPQVTNSWSASGQSFSYGVGIGVPINDRFEIELDLTQYAEGGLGLTLDSTLGAYSQTEATIASLGVRFRF